jgi:hypothetical protein
MRRAGSGLGGDSRLRDGNGGRTALPFSYPLAVFLSAMVALCARFAHNAIRCFSRLGSTFSPFHRTQWAGFTP